MNCDHIGFLQSDVKVLKKICSNLVDAKEGSSSVVKPVENLIKEEPRFSVNEFNHELSIFR